MDTGKTSRSLVVGLTCASLMACSSGSDSKAGLSVGFELQGSSAAEGTSAAIALVMRTGQGPLTSDLDITVSATGSSSPGADHDFTADRTVTFPSGSVNGTSIPIPVALTADNLVEGMNETLVLTLTDTGEAGASAPTHTLDIGEMDAAMLAFRTTGSATASEATPLAVEVELNLDPGDTLGVPIEATVTGVSGGSATPGVDYSMSLPQLVSFPIGAGDGARQTVQLTPLDDTDIEGDETLELALAGPTAGATIGMAAHTVTITDDDFSGPGHLLVNAALSGGASLPVTSGDPFNLGSAQVASGPNQALELTLNNAGGMPIELDPLELTGDVEDFSVALRTTSTALPPPTPTSFPFTVQADPEAGTRLTLSGTSYSALETAEHLLMESVALPGGGEITLVLERLPSPFTADAVVNLDGQSIAPELLLQDLSLWKGEALGYEGSEAFLSLSSTGSQGWVRLGDEHGTLHLTTDVSSGTPIVRWLWEAELDQIYTGDPPSTCLEERTIPGVAPSALGTGGTSGMSIGLSLAECTIAVETDYQFFQKFGDVTAATQYVTGLIAAVSDVYERDVQTQLTIGYLGIHSSSNDGWTTQETPGSSPGDLLDEFRAAWGGSIPGGADLAHFVSGASLGGGVAYVGALCNQSYGFGVSASVNGNLNWGTFSGAPSVANWDFVVVAHELGHNFGSSHTHSYCPPLDQCTTNCNGSNTCTPGTIMSYCHLCGGMANLRLEFHPFVAERIRSTVDSSCLAKTTLAGSGNMSLTVSFQPTTAAGAKAASLELRHTASNQPTPFVMNLTGTSTN